LRPRGYELVEAYVEPGASVTNDCRPEFQRMIEAGTSKPALFDVVIVHSLSRFFRTGVKNIVSYLDRNHIFTRDGGRWGVG
jgi:DNA invertase Pin-like site-specific DNA recombinase